MQVDGRPLVGRRQELERLARAVDTVAQGGSTVAVVAGPPGIGKTRLLAEVRRLAEAHRATVLSGRASEFERDVPFSVVVDALDDYLRAVPPDDLAGIPEEQRDELALVFPSLRASSGGPGSGSPDDRVRAYFAFRRLLEALAQPHPLVLVLDDLHWADRASIELLAHLVRRPAAGPVLVVAAYRPNQADADLVAVVGRAVREGAATYVEPGPLSAAEAGELVDAAGAERDRLHELSGGNPFLLLELVRPGAAEQGLQPAGDFPPVLAEAVVRELAPLGADARVLAEAASVVGDPFDLDLAIAAAGLPDARAFDTLDELARHDLVHATDVPRRFAWRHPLVRQAVHESLLPGRRLALHERCAALLASRGAPPVERAHHVEHAARPGDDEAVHVLTAAAEAAAARAPASAVGWLRAALRLLPAGAPASERLELVTRLAPLHTALGEVGEAHACLLEALALAPPDDRVLRTRLATACASMDQLLGNQQASHERLVGELGNLHDEDSREAVELMIALVMDSFYRKDTAGMAEWGRRAADGARRLGSRPLLAAAHAVRALAHALSGDPGECARHLGPAREIVDALSDGELAERVDAIGAIAGAELYVDQYADAVVHAERGLRVGRAAGTAATAPTLVPTLTTALWVVGRLEEALQVADESVEAARAARDEQATAWRLFNQAYVQIKIGHFADALRSAEESHAIATRLGDGFVSSWSAAILASARLEAGDAAGALEVLDRFCGGPTIASVPGGWRCYAFEVATRACLLLGRIDEAAATAGRSVAWAGQVGLPYARSWAARATALCELAAGRAAAAVEQARVAVEQAELVSARADAALSKVVLGRALRAAGDREEAVAVLRAAATDLDAMGAVRHRDEAERELGTLGSRPHRRTVRGAGDTGLSALTRRELEVARLVADRRTNPEIAATLFLSVKTVETHLRNIFRKLDVGSRADLARALEAGADEITAGG